MTHDRVSDVIRLPLRRPPHRLNLTGDELDVAVLVASGQSLERVAQELGLTLEAVVGRLCRVLAELSLSTSDPDEIAAALNTRLRERPPHTPAGT
jgi:hypothetical protein